MLLCVKALASVEVCAGSFISSPSELTQGAYGCLASSNLPAKFTVEFTGKALRHLEGLRKFDQNIILDGLGGSREEVALSGEPTALISSLGRLYFCQN